MAVFLITYDLKTPGQDYEDLYKAIKNIGPWAHYMESVWFVETQQSASQIKEILKTELDKNDYIFITKVTEYSGWAPKKMWDWLSTRV